MQPSLVLLDLVMPPPDGYQILRILRARPETRDLPVVVLTALEADEEIARAFEAGADDFVRKPFKPVELVARIRGQLRLRGMVDALAKKGQDARAGPRAHAGAGVEPRLPRHPLHGRAAHRRGGEGRPREHRPRARGGGHRLRRGRERRRAAARLAHRPGRSTRRSSRCSPAASRSSCPTWRRTRCSRSCATRGTRAPSARSPSCPSSTRGVPWASSSSARATPSPSATASSTSARRCRTRWPSRCATRA